MLSLRTTTSQHLAKGLINRALNRHIQRTLISSGQAPVIQRAIHQSRSLSFPQSNNQSNKREWVVDNPYTGETYVRIPLHSEQAINQAVKQSLQAFEAIKQLPLSDRQQIVGYFCDYLSNNQAKLAEQLTNQMGKPLKQSMGEISTAVARARSLIDQSNYALRERSFPVDYESYKQSHTQDVSIHAQSPVRNNQSNNQSNNQFVKNITLEPIGSVLCLAPWNYAYLCAVNSVATAVLCGDSVLLKMSDRVPLVGQAFEDGFKDAIQRYLQSSKQSNNQSNKSLQYVVQNLNIDHADVNRLIQNPAISFVQFTGSVGGGRAVNQAVYQRNDQALADQSSSPPNSQIKDPSNYQLINVGLELGGKDPAYLREDADLEWMVDSVIEGSLYNSGQSCCAVERVYVHRSIYQDVIKTINQSIKQWKVGNPMEESSTMGPLAQRGHGQKVDHAIKQSIKQGAKLLHGGFNDSIKQSNNQSNDPYRFFPPTVLADCTNDMPVMRNESFAPVVALCPVDDDDQAIKLMNDSAFGLTASVWTRDVNSFKSIAGRLEAGTVFMNRCDTLDPELCWAGRKNSGKGEGLSEFGFLPFVKTKSWNMKLRK